ncbi:WD domain, Gbeta repeat, domain containing protein [Acanthamoeba castellanii str. Neff]|uniref:WD domain, Gbeta repeat, domain containing protein n=1 Tax=Acanthamoeba castellanii (strain ATCC 30010 / Neff) TaxID=1257118 RepID=L8GW33_ACACF|nr:WD domain, Gbeta repeat, domain containing protein [Acanthamoeba castellanii str. Neff]ELR16301.1 WD domain, Gbeta repeat, domain containing protein [Acanthamoeba castellanii str. Neff]
MAEAGRAGPQRTVRQRATLTGHTQAVTAVRFSPDAKYFASASGDKTVKVWRLSDGALEITLGGENGHTGGISDVAWSHDSALLASCSDDRTTKVWDRATGTLKHNLSGHSNFVVSVDFHPKTYELASGSYDTKLFLWDVAGEKGRLRKIMVKHTAPVATVRYSKDGKYLLSTSYDGSCQVWNAVSGDLVKTISQSLVPITYKAHRNAKYALFSIALPGAKMVVSVSEDGWLYCWDLQSSTLLHKVKAHDGVALGMDAQGTTLITSGLTDNSIKIWDLVTTPAS